MIFKSCSLILFLALDRFILTLVWSHSSIEAISSSSYPSTSRICIAIRCRSGSRLISDSVIAVISLIDALLRPSLMPIDVNCSLKLLCLDRRLERSIAMLCAMRQT